ncbi:MAG TPA: hypothetical protein VID24_06420, partial [Candidatus Eremiobacteraceae bacterium]
MGRRSWLLLASVFFLLTIANFAIYAFKVHSINDRISIDRRVLGIPGVGVPTPGPTVTSKCVPNCAADLKVLDALVAAESKDERAARLGLDQAGKNLVTARSNSFVGE